MVIHKWHPHPRLLSILHTETLLPPWNTVLSTSISCSKLPHGFAGPAGWSPSSLARIHWSTTDPQLSFPVCPKAKWLMVTYVFPHVLSFHLECPPTTPKSKLYLISTLVQIFFLHWLIPEPTTHLHPLAGRNPLLLWNPRALFLLSACGIYHFIWDHRQFYTLIHSLSKHLLNTYYVSWTDRGAGDTVKSHSSRIPALMEITVLRRRQAIKRRNQTFNDHFP